MSEKLLAEYADKLRDFDYEIVGSREDGDEEYAVLVTARITTYDFGTVYLQTWKDYMAIDEDSRIESQFYTDLFTRFASLSAKNYTSDVDILCVPDGDGWKTDVKTNEALMNAISGGLVEQMRDLAEE